MLVLALALGIGIFLVLRGSPQSPAPTFAPTPSSSPTSLASPAPSSTPEPFTLTPEPLPTLTPEPLPTLTPEPSSAPTLTPTPTAIPTPTSSPAPSTTPVPTAEPEESAEPEEASEQAADLASAPEEEATPIPSSTPAPSSTPVPFTLSPEPLPTPTPEPFTLSLEPLPTPTPEPSSAPTPTPHVHIWADATCTEPKTCTVCGETEGEPLGHTVVTDEAVAATCTSSGLTEGSHCSVCDTVLVPQETIAPLGHTEVIDPVVEPTCTSSGLTEGSHCSVCNAVLVPQEEIEPLGHDWADATCTEPSTCTRCGATRGTAAGHRWIDPTCTEPATCSVCGATRGRPDGHSWASATCTEPKTCTVCDETEGDPLGHRVVTDPAIEPSCTESGLTEGSHCSVCGAVISPREEIEPLGHDWADPTCTEPATCTRCGDTKGEPLGHEWTEATETEPSTCVRCGEIRGEPLAPQVTPVPEADEPDSDAPEESTAVTSLETDEETKTEKVRLLSTHLRKGDYVQFGSYEQDAFVKNGEEPIEWMVLAVEEEKALLISRYALVNLPYESYMDTATWDSSSLRTWLNQEFYYTAFNKEEKTYLLTTEIQAAANPKYGGLPGNDTSDKVFILSIQEAQRYFSTDSERICYATKQLLYQNGGSTGTDYDGKCWWWLRTSGSGQANAAGVTMQGIIHNGGDSIHNENICVRPAIWVDLSPTSDSIEGVTLYDAEEGVNEVAKTDPEKAKEIADFLDNANEEGGVLAGGVVSFG